VVRKYETLFENNMKASSFYLQSKVFRAKECLEAAREQQAKAAQGHRQ
jgi:import inner membrane translocase subunit TIM16